MDGGVKLAALAGRPDLAGAWQALAAALRADVARAARAAAAADRGAVARRRSTAPAVAILVERVSLQAGRVEPKGSPSTPAPGKSFFESLFKKK